jgi:hypothetical protein
VHDRSKLLLRAGGLEAAAAGGLLAIGLETAAGAGIAFSGFATTVSALAVLAAVSLFYRFVRRNDRLADLTLYSALLIVAALSCVVATYVAARHAPGFYDPQLAAFDAALGFDWRRWFAAVARHPVLDVVLLAAYTSMLPQLVATIGYFALADMPERNKELFWLILVSSSLTAAVSYVYPSLGTFAYYGVALDRAVHLPHLGALQDAAAVRFSLDSLKGIVTFPSYHTAIAFLFTYVHRGRRRLFVPVAGLNLLMLVAIPTHGGHYLADMAGGALMAGLAILAVRRRGKARRPALFAAAGADCVAKVAGQRE